MWCSLRLCRASRFSRPLQGTLLSNVPKISFSTQIALRQIIYPAKNVQLFNNSRLTKLTNVLKSQSTFYCSRAPKPRSKKIVGYWLLGCSGMVLAAVALGGITRLTESGLSMVTWKMMGEKMPMTDEQWKEEFEKYKEYPEFKYKNSNITLSEFKTIWYMEYAHRMWGRVIGASVLIPTVFFWARGYLNKPMKIRVVVYNLLVAAQGLMGWYMVKSGLEDRFEGPSDVPRVSQYRLAAHLGLAFILYSGLFAGALKVLRPLGAVRTKTPGLSAVTALAHSVKAMVFFTAMSGAFVAGLDAGLVYNSFPKMGDSWLPDDIMSLSPKRVNLTENPTTVQFNHRILGCLTLLAATATAVVARRSKLSPLAHKVALATGAAAWLQVSLGILTLLHYVPVSLAASHQCGSLALLTFAIWLTHEVKLLKYIPK